jgi:Phage P22-like portal protein
MADAYSVTDDAQTDPDYEKATPELDLDQLLIRIKEWWREDQPHCKQWHTEAKLDFAFRAGDQWKAEDLEYMEETTKRACLTFNRIDPVIDSVVGAEITNRQEVRYLPRQVGDAPVNEVLTEGARWFRDQCDAEHEESNAFADAATCGIGWTETRLDYEDNPNGDPKIERIDPMEMFWDHAAKQANLVDARRIYRVRRKVPLIDVKVRWPVGPDGGPFLDDSSYDAGWAGNEADEETPYSVHTTGESLEHETSEGRQERFVTLVQVQWFEREEFYRALVANPLTGEQQNAELSEQQHMLASMRMPQVGMTYRAIKQTRKCYYQAFVGSEILEVNKVVAPSGKHATAFNFVPVTGKWDRNKGHFYGLVRGMRGPQTFANKWLSTTVEIMARAAKGGLMLEEGAVADSEDFETDWAKPGANSYFKPGAITGGKVQQKPATQFPSDFMQMTQFAIASIRDVVGVNPESLGQASQEQAASLEYQRRQSATVILAPLFDSLRRYRRIEGRVLLFLITEYLTDGRLIRIVGKEGESYVPLIRDPGVTEYDVIVDDAPSSPNQKELVWNSMVTMMPMIQNMQPPPEVILEILDYSPVPASMVAKIKQALARASQNAPPPPPDPMQLIMQEKQADIEADKIKKANDVQARQATARIELESLIATERVRLQGKQRETDLRLQEKRQDHLFEQQQRDVAAAKDAQSRHDSVVSPVVAEVGKSFSPIADAMLRGLAGLADSHANSTGMLLTELRKPRKRTLVRGQDGRASHAIEEIIGD